MRIKDDTIETDTEQVNRRGKKEESKEARESEDRLREETSWESTKDGGGEVRWKERGVQKGLRGEDAEAEAEAAEEIWSMKAK